MSYKEAAEFIEEICSENEILRKKLEDYEKKAKEESRVNTTKKIATAFSLDDSDIESFKNWDEEDLKKVETFASKIGAGNQSYGRQRLKVSSEDSDYENAKRMANDFLNS